MILAACSGDQPTAVTPIASIEISPTDATMFPGTTRQLTVTLRDANGQPLTGRPVTWTSLTSALSSVSATGLVTALFPGSALIEVSSGELSAFSQITILPAVATVQIAPPSPSIAPQETRQLTAVLLDGQGQPLSGREVSWSTDAPGVATITAGGLLTGISPGTASITATSEQKSGTAKIIVLPPAVATVTVSPQSPAIQVNDVLPLTVLLKDQDGHVLADRAVTWTTSDVSIATVSAAGVVTGVGGGTAIITAASEGVAGTTVVTVAPLPPVPTTIQLKILDLPDLPTEGAGFGAPVQVEIEDAAGARMAGAQNAVTLSLGGNLPGGTLSGVTTLNAVAGVVTFTGLSVDRAGRYHLAAASSGLTSATGADFTVTYRWISIMPNDQNTCAIRYTGELYCWGLNYAGQLGDGTQTDRLLPTLVNSPFRFSSVSTGMSATTCAVTVGGRTYCWGFGGDMLGGGGAIFRLSPGPVNPPVDAGATGVAVGLDHVCGVATGALYCWGSNDQSELGDGSVVLSRHLPGAVTQPANVTFASISSGDHASCALDTTGAGWCWGYGQDGNLGDGAMVNRGVPTRVQMPPGVTFVQLQINTGHACGLTPGGVIYCWGRNNRGQLGDGTTTNHITPQPVQAPAGVIFSRMSVGAEYTCGVATSGDAWCWGNNVAFELGDGTGNHRVLPRRVLSPAGVLFADISAGFAHTCALTTIGSAYCWGQNAFDELGDGMPHVPSAYPTRVIK